MGLFSCHVFVHSCILFPRPYASSPDTGVRCVAVGIPTRRLMSKVDRVTEEANLLRKQLEETSEELKKAKDAVAAEDTGVEGRQDMGDTDAAAELESEVRTVGHEKKCTYIYDLLSTRFS